MSIHQIDFCFGDSLNINSPGFIYSYKHNERVKIMEKKVLVISFDGVSDKVFERMANDPLTYPTIAMFKRDSAYTGAVKTTFVSNTYPVHTSVSTGLFPKDHQIISNYRKPRAWAQRSKLIKAKTLWDAAREKGLKTAAILWPVTVGAKITWNLPELHIHNLLGGSILFQAKAILRHGGKLEGRLAPHLDNFTTHVACDVLREKKPHLTFKHLVAYDSICHFSGAEGEEIKIAQKSLDDNLGKLLEAAPDNTTVIVLSDHGHLPVQETINLANHYGEYVVEQCGGSAFLRKEAAQMGSIQKHPWFGRYLTTKEMDESGYRHKADFGIAAKVGFCFCDSGLTYKSNHGYPTDYKDFRVFYAVRGKHHKPGESYTSGDIRDVTSIIAKELRLTLCYL